jgi:hypothetical protein
MFIYDDVSSPQLGEQDKQMLCMGESINSKELPCKEEVLVSGGTEIYTALFNYHTTLGKASCYRKPYY